jgi:hypothetical protein
MSAVAHLFRIARPDLYARSPFRVLRQAIEIGIAPVDLCGLAAQVHLGDDRGLALPAPVVTPESVDHIADVLRTPAQRLVEELFWWWDEARECGCPAEVHRVHDEAVHAHAFALAERHRRLPAAQRAARWRAAALEWRAALSHEGFWHHARHRAGDDVDPAELAALRAAFPAALLQPQAVWAEWQDHVELMAQLDEWDVDEDVREEARRNAAVSRLKEVEAAAAEVERYLDRQVPPSTHAVGELVKALYRAEETLPDERFRWTSE